MRKYTKYIALAVLLSMVTLGFASKNNLGINFLNIGSSSDLVEISKEKVEERIAKLVTEPITASLTVRDPYLFMTKCYSHVESNLGDRYKNVENPKFYTTQTIIGSVSLNYCGDIDVICKYQLDLNTNTVTVKESYLKPWVPLDDFLKQIETVEEAEAVEEK